MSDPLCPLIFGTTGAAEWRRQYRDDWGPAERTEFVNQLAAAGILPAEPFDPNIPAAPRFAPAPGSLCWSYVHGDAPPAPDGGAGGRLSPFPDTGSAVRPGAPILEYLRELARRALAWAADVARRVLELLAGVLGIGGQLLLFLLLAAVALLIAWRFGRKPARG